MVEPPEPSDASYARYMTELDEIMGSLKRRGTKMQLALSSMTDTSCNEAMGAMYLFPRINFPSKLVEHARLLSKEPDEVYAMALLNATGIVISSPFSP